MNKREMFKHYIGVNTQEEKEMLADLNLSSIEDLFSHIPKETFLNEMKMEDSLTHEQLKKRIEEISSKNKIKTSFIGDALQNFEVMPASSRISKIRGLTTAYTPYQPERSQGTLQSLWIYQSLISKLTGFEAINASLYDRSTCLYEAITCASRIHKKGKTILVSENILPQDIEVLNTHSEYTDINIEYVPCNKETGLIELEVLEKQINKHSDLCAFAFSQINCFGTIEDFDAITNLIHAKKMLVISIIELSSMSNNGLKSPASWGENGADIMVCEGQHMTIAPTFGGPGLGVFGIRNNERTPNYIRQTAGRFIGKAKDNKGRECKAIILSTREQHIRREKAHSNICSNQSFLASLCGATLLNKGARGMEKSFKMANDNAKKVVQEITTLNGVDLLNSNAIFNEFTIILNRNVQELIQLAAQEDLHIGVDISNRAGMNKKMLKISLSDRHTAHDIQKLINFFKANFQQGSISNTINSIHPNQKRLTQYKLKQFETGYLEEYYQKLGKQNLSPDEGIYPLGSCTMKYNPEINEWAAGLDQFCHTHPQAPEEDVQGNLEILFETQELFKDITGLSGVTTQPVAGAQGELVGLKMFQAFHKDNGEGEQRDIILIPRSAHGTNPATATMAGFYTKKIDGIQKGIVIVDANDHGEIDFDKFQELVKLYNKRIAGVMITNPNTSGIFETKFDKIAQEIHNVGGLVYMDGANMNAIAGWVDLGKLGVDAVHNNLHKTWSIPHGGGGPGDAIVAVSEKLVNYLPGIQVLKNEDGSFKTHTPIKSIGSFHRHFGNFGHKVRSYAYLKALGKDGIKRMSAIATLSARYLYKNLQGTYPTLPVGSEKNPRMHEFILTINDDTFKRIADAGTPKAQAIARIGKLFLDFGFHAPTVAFPEVYGLMLEPTESYTKDELDEFCKVVKNIYNTINEYPHILQTVPHFTPIDRVDEVTANKKPVLSEDITDSLAQIIPDRIDSEKLKTLGHEDLIKEILKSHEAQVR